MVTACVDDGGGVLLVWRLAVDEHVDDVTTGIISCDEPGDLVAGSDWPDWLERTEEIRVQVGASGGGEVEGHGDDVV